MAHGTTRARTGLSPFLLASSALIWISAVIVMGILSYLISLPGEAGSRIIYMEVIVRISLHATLCSCLVLCNALQCSAPP